MSTVPCGKYCSRCDKIVVDATKLDDHILHHLAETSDNLCLRVRRSQLNKVVFPTGNTTRLQDPVREISLMIFQELQQGGLMGAPVINTINADSSAQYLMGYITVNDVAYLKDVIITISEIGYAKPDTFGWFRFLIPMSAKGKVLSMRIHMNDAAPGSLQQDLTIERSDLQLLPTGTSSTFQHTFRQQQGHYMAHFRRSISCADRLAVDT